MHRILLTILLLIPVYAHSAEWILIGNSTTGDTFYIDETSVQKHQQLSTVREKQISRNGSIYKETVLVKTYDCENQTFSILEAMGYDSSGNLVFSEKFEKYYSQNPEKRWNSLTSKSLFSKSYNIACN